MKTSRFAFLSVLLPLVAGAATISDVSFRQDRVTREVTVNYALSNGGEPAFVTMEVLDGDGLAIASANLCPGKPNLPLGLRGKAGGCARVTAVPKRPHLGCREKFQ